MEWQVSAEDEVVMAEPPYDFTRSPRRDVTEREPEWRSLSHLSQVELRLARVHLGLERADDYDGPRRALLVGENPGPHTHADTPLFPWPESSSAGRLMAMSELTPGQYLGCLYRRNLADVEWSKREARARARRIVTALFDSPKDLRVVLCGAKVGRAFQLSVEFWEVTRLVSGQMAVVIPHPSGKNLLYNDQWNRERTGRWMRWAALGEDVPE